jgi:hypothetical protein
VKKYVGHFDFNDEDYVGYNGEMYGGILEIVSEPGLTLTQP